MPKYYEDKEEDSRACAGIREDFKACLLQHDCVVKVRNRPSGTPEPQVWNLVMWFDNSALYKTWNISNDLLLIMSFPLIQIYL